MISITDSLEGYPWVAHQQILGSGRFKLVADSLKHDIPRLSRGGVVRVVCSIKIYETMVSLMIGFLAVAPLLIGVVADYFGLDASQLQFPGKGRHLVRAKAVICFVAVRYYHQPGYQVAQRLGYSSSAESRAVERGRVVFNDCCDLRMLANK